VSTKGRKRKKKNRKFLRLCNKLLEQRLENPEIQRDIAKLFQDYLLFGCATFETDGIPK
jgi:hypothetical protein